MLSCLDCFTKVCVTGLQQQELVDRENPEFFCEGTKCSKYSPGLVKDDEEIIFLLIDPIHYDVVTKTVLPTAFDQVILRDLSVIRRSHASVQDLEVTCAELKSRGNVARPRDVTEACVATVAELRNATIDGSRTFAVYDTALPTKQHHASIFTRSIWLQDRRARRRVRQRLYEVMTQQVIPLHTLA